MPTVKHDGETLWFRAVSGVWCVASNEDRWEMDAAKCLQMMEENLLPYEEDPHVSWIFHQNNDPKHITLTQKLVFQQKLK